MGHHCVSAELLSEIESLRRERDELRALVRLQEVELSPRSGGHGPSPGGRARSLETRQDLDRLVAAQEATANSHVGSITLATMGLGIPATHGCHTAPQLRAPCRRSAARLPSPSPSARQSACKARGCSSCCCQCPGSRRSGSAGGNVARRHTPSTAGTPAFGGLPHGSGRRGPGHPQGRGSGARQTPNLQSRPRTPTLQAHPSPRLAKQAPPQEPRRVPQNVVGCSPRDSCVEAAVGEALRGLGGARGELADAARQLSQETKRRHSEAWRLRRLEQELRALRADSARGRGQAVHRSRCQSCARC